MAYLPSAGCGVLRMPGSHDLRGAIHLPSAYADFLRVLPCYLFVASVSSASDAQLASARFEECKAEINDALDGLPKVVFELAVCVSLTVLQPGRPLLFQSYRDQEERRRKDFQVQVSISADPRCCSSTDTRQVWFLQAIPAVRVFPHGPKVKAPLAAICFAADPFLTGGRVVSRLTRCFQNAKHVETVGT